MSYSIHNNKDQVVVQYKDLGQSSEITFYSEILESDVKEGLTIPVYLQSELNNRVRLEYPTKAEDVRLFAFAYKQIVYLGELVKHGFYIKEAEVDLSKVINRV